MLARNSKNSMTSGLVFVGKIFNGGNMGRETQINKLIDIERFKKNNTMTMSMKGYGVRDEKMPESRVDSNANSLVMLFGSPQSKALYCDAVRYLTKAFIDEQIKIALDKGHEPAKLFTYLINKKLRSIGLYA